jgi:hypothetical protein
MAYYDSFRAARWIRFINLVLQAILFLTLFAGLNYIALSHAWRFDLTETRRHSLSAETRSYLERLDRNVQIVVTLTPDSGGEEGALAFRDISGLLREYVYLTRNNPKGKIEVRYLDVYQHRREAEALEVEQPNQVVLLSENNRRVIPLAEFYETKNNMKREAFRGEVTITAALLDVSSPEKKKIYFLAGHGEMRPDDVDRRRGLSALRDSLRQRNFDVAVVDLSLTRKVPDDAAMLVLSSPQGRLQPFEEEILRTYLTTRAGRLFVLLDPGLPHGLETLFFDWGVTVYDNVIIDLNPESSTENNDMRLWRFLGNTTSRITDVLLKNKMFIICGPARVVSDDLGRALDDGLSVKKLIATSPEAWGEASYRLRNVMPQYTPEQDLRGELGVMVISERLKPANLPLSVKGGRLAVIGTADLVTNNRIFNTGNLNLFLSTVNWMVDRDTQLNIPARPIQRFQIALSGEELSHLRLILLLALPGCVGLLGLIVYWSRRN